MPDPQGPSDAGIDGVGARLFTLPFRNDHALDAARTQANAKNAANRQKLLAYPFYRNAFVGVLAALEDPHNVDGLPSADFSSSIRCTTFFQDKAARGRPFAIVLKGQPHDIYNATTEICQVPALTRFAP
ncbi:MAG: hypothetical protein E6J90_49705 [Deltaproteobacteria bacterium]|nr:MAG: hypothetical protein E6J91_50310 [Deltaproteobacteria bacterium]TMQ05199.1 MAG: hypothetical protein E6J90_49705 [Deltaproteobacteria bacterium]